MRRHGSSGLTSGEFALSRTYHGFLRTHPWGRRRKGGVPPEPVPFPAEASRPGRLVAVTACPGRHETPGRNSDGRHPDGRRRTPSVFSPPTWVPSPHGSTAPPPHLRERRRDAGAVSRSRRRGVCGDAAAEELGRHEPAAQGSGHRGQNREEDAPPAAGQPRGGGAA